MSDAAPLTVVITGGFGNLGTKLCRHLLSQNVDPAAPRYRVVLVEHPAFVADRPAPHSDAVVLPCDLGAPGPAAGPLRAALTGADALVHFSAVNPYPNADWSESAQSMDHCFYVFQLAVLCRVRRVVLASSNHVMGGYKDDPDHGPASVHPGSAPRVGTLPRDPAQVAVSGDAVAYAAAKLAGERLARTLAALHGDITTFVVLRIGWCQPGENRPGTLSAAGAPPEFLAAGEAAAPAAEDDGEDELWFRRMWLSNRDFAAYFEAALRLAAPSEDPPEGAGGSTHGHARRGFVLLNAMSRNEGAKWCLEETAAWTGVASEDDALA